ncbi:MAG: M20/M25/M40 family metallo-hydrolase [Mucilaginibacter polytrichastri]|nr:M20/M25/M40 family metallo-hydrolase [Mucilaginibacter polytrichastri]
MKKIYTFLAATALYGAVFAQENPESAVIGKIRSEEMSKSEVMKTAFYLTDVSGPRLSNSPGLKRAQNWAVEQLKSWGLQNVKLEPWGKFGRGWEIEKAYAAISAPYYHPIIAVPKAWSGSTAGAINADVVLIRVDTLSDLEQYTGKLAGKAVIAWTDKALERTFAADAKRYSDEELAEMAAAEGGERNRNADVSPEMMKRMAEYRKMRDMRTAISGFLKKEKVALILSQARGTDGTVFTSNGNSYAEDAPEAAPELEVSGEDYLRIVRLLNAKVPVKIDADIRTKFFSEDLQGYNVIGEIPGTDKKLKDEVVMLGGHLDSWHAATGATDNAAGSAVMMEAVRLIKSLGLQPKRTIRIALWSSEEQGLFGSRNYVLNHFGDPKTMKLTADQKKISAYYNLDNGTGKIRGVYLQGNATVKPIFENWLKPFHDLGAKTLTLRNTGGTDHLAFDAVGIPGFQFIQDPVDYNARTHHSNEDTFDRLIEDDLKQASAIVAAFVYGTAQRATALPRKPLPEPQPDRTQAAPPATPKKAR